MMEKTNKELAEWMHNTYEKLAKANNWQTQEKTRVDFKDLPAENKATMLALANELQNTFGVCKERLINKHVRDLMRKTYDFYRDGKTPSDTMHANLENDYTELFKLLLMRC